jgi:hypothetical protein
MKKIISYGAVAVIGLIASPIALLFLMLLIAVIGGVIITLGGLVTVIITSLIPLMALGAIGVGLAFAGAYVIDSLRE